MNRDAQLGREHGPVVGRRPRNVAELRAHRLGAPRAFDTAVLRRFGFPNVSYGEDYAVALRISRQYEIGRIYDSLYLCRRWEGNTDSALPPDVADRYDQYKDWVRTMEIRARTTNR